MTYESYRSYIYPRRLGDPIIPLLPMAAAFREVIEGSAGIRIGARRGQVIGDATVRTH